MKTISIVAASIILSITLLHADSSEKASSMKYGNSMMMQKKDNMHMNDEDSYMMKHKKNASEKYGSGKKMKDKDSHMMENNKMKDKESYMMKHEMDN